MATTTSSTPRTTAAKRSATAQKAATTRRTNATKRSTTAKKAAATRRQTTAAKQAAEAKQETKNTVKRAGGMVEKAVLVPMGAALVARDGVIATIDEMRANYSTRNKTEQELRRYERRGSSAVKGIERDVKSMVKDIESRAVTKNVELVAARVENVVAGGRNVAAKVTERITALA
jgi:hypothetical protein